jgi:carboxypeptidase Taq
METPIAPYRKLLDRAREIALLAGAAEVLNWDAETYMPPKALEFRALEMAHLGGAAHRLFTVKKVGEWIAACEQHAFPPDSAEAANVREWRRRYDRATKIPARLVEKFERTKALAREVWKQARKESKFKLFQPHLKKLVELNRQRADLWGFQESPYDALVEEYEPGMTAGRLRALFGELRPAIVSVLRPAAERSAAVPADALDGDYPVAAQQALNRKVAEAMGYDFQAGRIDTTTHPFCTTLGPGDCRLTTRYNERNFTQSFYGILHEAGHGLYEQGLPAEHFGTPLGAAVSLGVHESQSRLWENHVGRHRAFWEHWHPVACEHFPHLRSLTPDQIFAVVNRVAPSFIRVEADQVTYDLHIILRFELEVKLIEGQLAVAEVPGCWNEEFEKMFGLKVPNDALGCLQDIHWSIGTQGYFPTYTLGNLNAAQLFQRAKAELPNLEADLARGQYQSLLGWLREKVHRHGSRYSPQELIERASGQPTNIAPHVEYLRAKFGGS